MFALHAGYRGFITGLFVVVFRPTREISTLMENSSLLVKGFKFWSIRGNHGHWAVGYSTWNETSVYNGHLWGPVTHTRDSHTCCRTFSSCHFPFKWLRSVASRIWTSNPPHASGTLLPTAPPPRFNPQWEQTYVVHTDSDSAIATGVSVMGPRRWPN